MTKLLFLSLLLLLVTLQKTSARKPFNVTYDQRALILDGQRRMLISAGIHYPRAVPEMWPDILANSKEGGADVVQTYVFWDGHEPQQGTYNFEGRFDLVKFAQLVMEAGLYLHLRIGPYVCAEWNFGGFPVWLRDVPGIVFRTDNQPFKDAMEGFVTKIVDMMKENQLFAWQGGPIILAQIENEYGNIEWEFGDAGKRYVDWAANMALSLDTGVPWIMCQQNDAPGNIINTCNGYYCDQWKPNAATKPMFWTEDWNGWYQDWGQSAPHRPVEDNAFAVARFFQLGGSFQNYYMYYGGTNFARTAGGPFITTSYDYDAPIDEYGLIRQPKWGHLKELHAAIKLCEPALTAIDGAPTYVWLGSNQEAHVYSGAGYCAAFLANIDNSASVTVQFEGQSYVLPSWSVSILPDCKNVVFNTAQVSTQTTLTSMRKSLPKPTPEILMPSSAMPNEHISDGPLAGGGLRWQSSVEPVGIRNSRTITANALLEQINITKDTTDYLWYSISVTVPEEDLESLNNTGAQAQLVLETMRDTVHIFVNGELTGSAVGWNVRVVQPVTLQRGNNSIDLLSMTMGLQNYGAFLETWGAGIRGSVLLTGLPSGDQDLSAAKWVYQVGLQGEDLQIFNEDVAGNVTWDSPSAIPNGAPLTWYKTTFDAPGGMEPVALDLGTMGKGQAWVNGKHLGRFWPSLLAPQSGCSWCDYRGAYNPNKCRTNCGEPSQRWYHVPRAWLEPTDNLLVIFEEIGGDPSQISVVTRSPDMVCARLSESHPPPLQFWGGNHTKTESSFPSPELQLECALGHHIVDVTFASFGNPVGLCGEHFGLGKCHSVDTIATVRKACMGKQRCSLTVNWQTFGDSDPCPSITKSLAVQGRCSSDNQGPTSEEPAKYLRYPWQRSVEIDNHPARKPTLLISVLLGDNCFWMQISGLYPNSVHNRWQSWTAFVLPKTLTSCWKEVALR